MPHATLGTPKAPLLSVRELQRTIGDKAVFQGISFDIDPEQILFLVGPSGVGKSLLLRAVAQLDPYQGGIIKYKGRTPTQIGIPSWRAEVTYVHQSRINFKGTPNQFWHEVQEFGSQSSRGPRGDLTALVQELGLEAAVLDQQWAELSGGQAQRVALAIAIALRPPVLLLDEPTSACDAAATLRVERVVAGCGSAVVWVTHDELQPLRVGGRQLELPSGALTQVVAVPWARIGSSGSLHMTPVPSSGNVAALACDDASDSGSAGWRRPPSQVSLLPSQAEEPAAASTAAGA